VTYLGAGKKKPFSPKRIKTTTTQKHRLGRNACGLDTRCGLIGQVVIIEKGQGIIMMTQFED